MNIEKLAQAALRGFFNDSEGFKDMKHGNAAKAVKAISLICSGTPEQDLGLDQWYAFECYSHDEPSGLIFQVRFNGTRIESAPCPVCGKLCVLRSTWHAE